jgi:hypothetical protein
VDDTPLAERWHQIGLIEIYEALLGLLCATAVGLDATFGDASTPELVAVSLLLGVVLAVYVRHHRLRVDPGRMRAVLLIGFFRPVRLQDIVEIRLPLSGATYHHAELLLVDGTKRGVPRLRMSLPTVRWGSGKWALRGCIWISRWVGRTTGRCAPVRLVDVTSSWPGIPLPLFSLPEPPPGSIVFPPDAEDDAPSTGGAHLRGRRVALRRMAAILRSPRVTSAPPRTKATTRGYPSAPTASMSGLDPESLSAQEATMPIVAIRRQRTATALSVAPDRPQLALR